MTNVLMVSTFGPNVRGVSPYADSLTRALEEQPTVTLDRLDYLNAFPRFILPKDTPYDANNEYARINYLNPWSWNITRRKHYDVIHVQYWSPAFLPIIFAILYASRKRTTKIIVTWHNPAPHEDIPMLGMLEKQLLTLCDAIIVHTEHGKALIKKLSPKSILKVCHHGCEITGIEVAKPEDYQLCKLEQDHEYLLFFGNIRPYKGLDVLIDAWRSIADEFPNTRLVVAGRLW